MEYPKTENLYARDPVTHKVGPENGFRQEAVGQVSRWVVTEKVDGMNMRVVFYPYGVSDDPGEPYLKFYGRTDRAQIPGDLLQHMEETFTVNKLFAAMDYPPEGLDGQEAYKTNVVLFGEGYGPGIQKAGQAYGGEKRFILFDVLVDGKFWLRMSDVQDVGSKLGVPVVPVLCENCDLEETKGVVRTSALQAPCSEHIEGIVARTDPYLFDSRGNRVAFKYKVRDL